MAHHLAPKLGTTGVSLPPQASSYLRCILGLVPALPLELHLSIRRYKVQGLLHTHHFSLTATCAFLLSHQREHRALETSPGDFLHVSCFLGFLFCCHLVGPLKNSLVICICLLHIWHFPFRSLTGRSHELFFWPIPASGRGPRRCA